MRIKRSTRFDLCKNIFTRTMVIPRTWIRNEMVYYSRIQSTRRMGQSCGADDVNICRKQTPNFPIHESMIQRSAQKQRWWKLSIHYCADLETIETVFRTMISVFTRSRTALHDKAHWRVLTICRASDSTFCHEMKIQLTRKVGSREHLGPVLEVTTSYLQGKYGVEIRIESINKDHSHSWVRISHGLNKLVTNLNNEEQDDNEQETSEMQFEDCGLKTNVLSFASRSKAKAKPQRQSSASSSTQTILIGWKNLGRYWTKRLFAHRLSSVEETDQSSSSWLSTSRRRWSAWILEIHKMIFRTILCILNIGLMKCGKAQWQNEEETRKDFSIVLILQEKFFTSSSSRSLRTQSHWSFIAGQWIKSGRFLRVHLTRRMCNQFTVHHQFRIDTGRSTF